MKKKDCIQCINLDGKAESKVYVETEYTLRKK